MWTKKSFVLSYDKRRTSCKDVTDQSNNTTATQSMKNEKQDHKEVIEIDIIPSLTSNDGDNEELDHAENAELKKSDAKQADLPNPDNGLQKWQKHVDHNVKTELQQVSVVQLSVRRKDDSIFPLICDLSREKVH